MLISWLMDDFGLDSNNCLGWIMFDISWQQGQVTEKFPSFPVGDFFDLGGFFGQSIYVLGTNCEHFTDILYIWLFPKIGVLYPKMDGL